MKKLLWLLLALPGLVQAGEVGSYPNANALTGVERLLADQNGTTVNITPLQLQTFLGFPSSNIVTWTGSIIAGHCAVWLNSIGLAGDGGASCTGVSSITGDGSLISNSASQGAVTLTLNTTGVAYGVWGNIGSSSGSPGYHSLSSYPAAAFPTLNQSTSGLAGGLSGSPTNGQFWGYNGTSQGWYTPPTGLVVQTGGANNTSQVLLNFVAGAGLTITNPSGGIENFASTYGINAQTGTTYTIASTDATLLDTFSNSSAIAVTLPQATTTGFTSGFSFDALNKGPSSGAAGAVTITPTTSTINGQTKLVLMQGEWSQGTVSDGANYQVAATNAVHAYPAMTVTGVGCTPTVGTGAGPDRGTITLATGPCTAITITFGYSASAAGNWKCSVHDRTLQQAGSWFQDWGENTAVSAVNQTQIPIPTAAGVADVLSVKCDRW